MKMNYARRITQGLAGVLGFSGPRVDEDDKPGSETRVNQHIGLRLVGSNRYAKVLPDMPSVGCLHNEDNEDNDWVWPLSPETLFPPVPPLDARLFSWRLPLLELLEHATRDAEDVRAAVKRLLRQAVAEAKDKAPNVDDLLALRERIVEQLSNVKSDLGYLRPPTAAELAQAAVDMLRNHIGGFIAVADAVHGQLNGLRTTWFLLTDRGEPQPIRTHSGRSVPTPHS